MFLDIFRCLQKLIIIVNIVTGNHVIQRHIRTQLNIYDGDIFCGNNEGLSAVN